MHGPSAVGSRSSATKIRREDLLELRPEVYLPRSLPEVSEAWAAACVVTPRRVREVPTTIQPLSVSDRKEEDCESIHPTPVDNWTKCLPDSTGEPEHDLFF